MARCPQTRRSCCRKPMATLQVALAIFVVLFSLASLYSVGLFLHSGSSSSSPSVNLRHLLPPEVDGYTEFLGKALSDRVEDVLQKLVNLQERLQSEVEKLDRRNTTSLGEEEEGQTIPRSQLRKFLDEEVIQPLYEARVSLNLVRIPTGPSLEDPLTSFFKVEEIRKYITPRENRLGMRGVYGYQKTHSTIGHSCVLVQKELEEYMSYEVGSYCRDDWLLGQRLMLSGCNPLPQRRCLARASKLYLRPFPINESLWRVPEDRNVRWSNYRCRSFACLSGNGTGRGFHKCSGCFDFDKEKLKWVVNGSSGVDFLIREVMGFKPGEIRIGLDVSVGTGTFAARMREWNVTIVSTALNVGAPFSETIALRGLVPLYVTLSQRLPFFDNTMDIIHTTVFLDGWIDLQVLHFVIYDWDRVLRPGGLLWIDKFFCNRRDIEDYMYMFLQLRYKKHKWVVAPKSGEEVYFSALLEKTPRSL